MWQRAGKVERWKGGKGERKGTDKRILMVRIVGA
jgi:hypothetical protein